MEKKTATAAALRAARAYANREGGATACASCAAGMYSCCCRECGLRLCPAGQYQPEPGNSLCTDVSPGHWSSIGASTQRPWRRCPAGKYGVHGSATSSGTCQDCAAGTFKAAEGPYEAQCLKCEPGSYQPAAGRDECTLCSIGLYQDRRGATGCKNCSAGRYGSVTGAASISDCPSCALGSYNEEEGPRKAMHAVREWPPRPRGAVACEPQATLPRMHPRALFPPSNDRESRCYACQRRMRAVLGRAVPA